MKKIILLFVKIFELFNKIWYRCFVLPIKRCRLSKCGKNCYIGKNVNLSYSNIEIGDNVSIGSNCMFMSSLAKIKIGNYVMFGPYVTIITGDHRIDVKDKYMAELTDKEKLPENDQDVIIEDDCWIGANVTILKGVTISKGSVVGAGSIVVKNIPQYSIVVGQSAKVIKKRFENNDDKFIL